MKNREDKQVEHTKKEKENKRNGNKKGKICAGWGNKG
jgi:hypothetical protein